MTDFTDLKSAFGATQGDLTKQYKANAEEAYQEAFQKVAQKHLLDLLQNIGSFVFRSNTGLAYISGWREYAFHLNAPKFAIPRIGLRIDEEGLSVERFANENTDKPVEKEVIFRMMPVVCKDGSVQLVVEKKNEKGTVLVTLDQNKKVVSDADVGLVFEALCAALEPSLREFTAQATPVPA